MFITAESFRPAGSPFPLYHHSVDKIIKTESRSLYQLLKFPVLYALHGPLVRQNIIYANARLPYFLVY